MYIICFVLSLGLLLFFFDDIAAALLFLRAHYAQYLQRASAFVKKRFSRKLSLKARVEILKSGKKENFILRSYHNMSSILDATGEADKLKNMRRVAAVCAAGGLLLALYLRSFMLVPILTTGCGLLPMWLMKFKLFRYNLRMQNELSVVLSVVTTSYLRSENLVKSVEENLTHMNEPCKSFFQSFVFSSKLVDSNPIKNLSLLRGKIDNHIFHLWCNTLIVCQNDINQKASLSAVVTQFTVDKELHNMLAAEITKPLWYFLAIAGLSGMCFPLVGFMGHQFHMGDLLSALFTTFVGQLLVVGYAVTLLVGLSKAIDLSTSME